MLDPPSWSRGVRRPTEPPGGAPAAPTPRLPEPPEFKAHPFAPPVGCTDCGREVHSSYSVPRCWECARPLCADCFWQHRSAPADHRCSACAARTGAVSTSTSGAIAHRASISGATSSASR